MFDIGFTRNFYIFFQVVLLLTTSQATDRDLEEGLKNQNEHQLSGGFNNEAQSLHYAEEPQSLWWRSRTRVIDKPNRSSSYVSTTNTNTLSNSESSSLTTSGDQSSGTTATKDDIVDSQSSEETSSATSATTVSSDINTFDSEVFVPPLGSINSEVKENETTKGAESTFTTSTASLSISNDDTKYEEDANTTPAGAKQHTTSVTTQETSTLGNEVTEASTSVPNVSKLVTTAAIKNDPPSAVGVIGYWTHFFHAGSPPVSNPSSAHSEKGNTVNYVDSIATTSELTSKTISGSSPTFDDVGVKEKLPSTKYPMIRCKGNDAVMEIGFSTESKEGGRVNIKKVPEVQDCEPHSHGTSRAKCHHSVSKANLHSTQEGHLKAVSPIVVILENILPEGSENERTIPDISTFIERKALKKSTPTWVLRKKNRNQENTE